MLFETPKTSVASPDSFPEKIEIVVHRGFESQRTRATSSKYNYEKTYLPR